MPKDGGGLPGILVLEVLRQAGFLVAHVAVGVPLDWHLVTRRFGFVWECRPTVLPSAPGFPFDLIGHVDVGERGALAFAAELWHDGAIAARGSIEAVSLAPDRYSALRRSALAGAAAQAVELTSPLSPSDRLWVVRWHDGDAFLFNRPGDHVVSMALMDAVLSRVESGAAGLRGVSVDMEVVQFAERTGTITLHLTEGQPRGEQRWEFRQAGLLVARARTRPSVD
jgi:hypothetical protein